MNSHSIFYYPYASFTGYFDKLYILDPEKSSSGMIGIQNPDVAKDAALLEHKSIHIALRDDMQDRKFIQHCATSDMLPPA